MSSNTKVQPAIKRLLSRARMAKVRAANLLREVGVPLRPSARIVYHPDYAYRFANAETWHAFDVRRADRIVDQLVRCKVLSMNQILYPQPVSRDDLLLVHTPGFLHEISYPQRLAEILMIGLENPRDNQLLDTILLHTGGTILAVEHALKERLPVFNLGGGFHHAQCDRAEGFCAINDIAIAIKRLQKRHLVRKVLVIDLDYHHGNGTALIFSNDESVYTLSIHGQNWVTIVDKQNNLDLELPPQITDKPYLAAVRNSLTKVLSSFQPDIAIYVAGADPHKADSLGDFALTEDGLLQRDLMVLEAMEKREIPMAVLLSGGYGSLAWTIPYNFICSTITKMPIASTNRPSNIRARLHRIRERLPESVLKEGDVELDEDDLADLLSKGSGTSRYLGFYSQEGLYTAFERYGFFDQIRERGFENLILSISVNDPDRQLLRIHYDQKDPEHLLVELVTRYDTLVTPEDAVKDGAEKQYHLLRIEWLMMQNPKATFSLDRPKLPGQQHPGLGLGRWMLELLRLMAERLTCSGLVTHPQHYHNGLLYSKQLLYFYPEDQGYLEAMKRDLGHLPLVDTSVAIDEGRLLDAQTGLVLQWEGKPQVMPVDSKLNKYFIRPAYRQAVVEARKRYHFKLADT